MKREPLFRHLRTQCFFFHSCRSPPFHFSNSPSFKDLDAAVQLRGEKHFPMVSAVGSREAAQGSRRRNPDRQRLEELSNTARGDRAPSPPEADDNIPEPVAVVGRTCASGRLFQRQGA
ncbi:hypothetical protein SKAU_G00048320 [Synaphobranchus kaupii]|uniref:Uncharacterized protein n=1 Tax=Synaphobranchus kaupii TaxID=118154 RepID=A0A9Q1J9I1_SYNKA|nr:hypothetical protein SKAU_G00048320 [Synaphobranchus kaupii]